LPTASPIGQPLPPLDNLQYSSVSFNSRVVETNCWADVRKDERTHSTAPYGAEHPGWRAIMRDGQGSCRASGESATIGDRERRRALGSHRPASIPARHAPCRCSESERSFGRASPRHAFEERLPGSAGLRLLTRRRKSKHDHSVSQAPPVMWEPRASGGTERSSTRPPNTYQAPACQVETPSSFVREADAE